MSKQYQNNGSNEHPEDTDFGCDLSFQCSDNSIVNDDDEDDEFGGGKLTVELIYGRKGLAKTAVAVVNDIDDGDDEFGGGKLTVELIYGRRGLAKNKEVEVEVKVIEDEVTEDDEDDKNTIIFTCDHKIFSPIIGNNQWYVDRDNLEDSVSNPYLSITIPLVIDTEFTDNHGKKEYQQKSRMPLTTQICGIGSDTPKAIFALTASVNGGRIMAGVEELPLIETDFHPIDYLRYSVGLDVNIWEVPDSELKELPKCFVVLYGHFLTAEINMIASGTVKERIKALQQSQGDEQIASGRRAYCQKIVDGQSLDWVSLKHIISIEGYNYELCLKLVDTGAIHGVASYKDFCSAVGWELKYKDNFTPAQKSKMFDMAIERFEDFENYALGDLDVYEALNSYYEQWKIVYEKLGLGEYFQCPKLTIGGTVKTLFEAALAHKLGIPPMDEKTETDWRKNLSVIVDQYIKPTSANDLRQFSTHTRALLAKVEGGRCRNNRPTDIFVRRKVKGQYDAVLICDIDISGCYGEGQRNQEYFLGTPEIFDYKASKNNEYISLRDWLKAYDVDVEKLIKAFNDKDNEAWKNPNNWGELISGAWYARIRTKERLTYAQDYFASWFTESADRVDLLAKAIRKMKSDTEMVSSDWVNFDEDCGNLKIFNHEIWNGVLNHDGLQWILAITSPRQRNEMLDKIQILASAVYPRSQRIIENSPAESFLKLQELNKNWDGKNTTERIKVNGRSKIVMNFDECHAWFGINLGELIIDNLLIERKKAQKTHGKKSPLDVLFKLCVNTLYGDMVSKHFITSNPVVGNNITARARSLAWYMEKGLHGWQSITDGCAFELNGVFYAKNKNITGEIVNQHRNESDLKQRNIKRSPVANAQEILGYWTKYTTYNKEKTNKTETKFVLGLIVDGLDIAPIIKNDKEHEGCQTAYSPALEWIDSKAMEHLQSIFPLVDVLHSDSTAIKVNDDLSVEYKARKGQFSFETKDIYHSAAFHGSANYILVNPNGANIKARAYEVKKNHQAVESETIAEGDEIKFMKSDRYGVENNPAKDFLNQLLENPENVKRQIPAIKSGILKITDYKNLSGKYDEIGIEPGDGVQKAFLMQEFSLSQFTFQTYEQYMMWSKIINHLKQTERQSLEGYFLNSDGTLNFLKMAEWVDEKIAEGIDKPFDLLADPNRHDRRTEKRSKKPIKDGKGSGKRQKIVSLSHPEITTFNSLREQLKEKILPTDVTPE